MRKGFRKLFAIATASLLAAGALSLSACGNGFTPPAGAVDGDVSSNGGFVVAKGEYYYFINGVETYTSDNTYGAPVKGTLQRIKKDDVHAQTNTAETVIPSLMVAGDYNAGLFIYGDRIYYATPNNVRDTSGTIQSGYLDFKSAKLDGTDIEDICRVSSNTTPYRFVQPKADGPVYLVYVESNDIYSVNTSTSESTMLADNTTSYVFNRNDVTDPYIYYTMGVTDHLDSDNSVSYSGYNQIYRVSADATKETAPHKYVWDEDYIRDELDGKEPYTNLGEIVLDGRANTDLKTQFNYSDTEPGVEGHTYTLQTYENNGIYYVDTPTVKTGSVGGADKLLYLSADKLTASWDSVAGNMSQDAAVVANSSNRSNASTSALFYIDDAGAHHYLYVNGNSIYRADVKTDGSGDTAEGGDLAVAFDVSGATLVSLDLTSNAAYEYAYFTRSNGAGRSVERAVINGSEEVYKNLTPEEEAAPYQAVKVLDVEHASSWYPFELIGCDLFYADADNEVASTSYNYIATVSLADGSGELMDNVELKEFTDKYNSIMSTDSKVGLISKLSANSNSKLSTAVKYYFYTGETQAFLDNISEATAAGKKDTYLYTAAEQDAFDAFATGKGYSQDENTELFSADDYKDGEKSYRVRSYFITEIGKVKDEDVTARSDYWKTALQHYTEPEEEGGLPGWAWALIGIGIAFVVLCAAAVVLGVIVYKKNKKTEAPKQERLSVDTTDDRSVDVYADSEGAPEASAEEPAEEPSEESSEEASEEVSEEPAEEVPEEVSGAEDAEKPSSDGDGTDSE